MRGPVLAGLGVAVVVVIVGVVTSRADDEGNGLGAGLLTLAIWMGLTAAAGVASGLRRRPLLDCVPFAAALTVGFVVVVIWRMATEVEGSWVPPLLLAVIAGGCSAAVHLCSALVGSLLRPRADV
jgi:hypothetical protein